MTDRQFLSRFRKALDAMQANKAAKWVATYLASAKSLANELETAIPAVEHAEAAWHTEAGTKLGAVDEAEARYRHWANHVKADVHGAELGEFISDYHSVAGFEEALSKMTDAFDHRAHGKGKNPVDAYAAEALKDLRKQHDAIEALLLETRDTWQRFRDAAATKNAAKARAWEIFKSVRRHLKADLGDNAVIAELKTPPRHAKKPVSQPTAPPVP